MQGPNIVDIDVQGIIPRMIRTIFSRIETANQNLEFTVMVEMCEIYKEKIRDLLNVKKTDLKIHEQVGKGIYVDDLT